MSDEWNGETIWCSRIDNKECVSAYQYVSVGAKLPRNTCELCVQLSTAEAINKLADAITIRGPRNVKARHNGHSKVRELVLSDATPVKFRTVDVNDYDPDK